MTEVEGYVPWPGQLTRTSRIGIVAWDELRRLRTNTWGVLAVGAGLAWGLASIIELYQLRDAGNPAHAISGFLAMLDQLRWFVLAAVAVVGASALLEDARLGALELYLSRPLTRGDHLAGKALALVVICLGMFALPILAYTVTSYAFFDEHPNGWMWAPLSGLAYGLLWSLMVAGLALGVSCVARSGRTAALLLFGGAVVVHVTAVNVLPQLTESSWLAIFSPFNAMEATQPWLWDVPAKGDFPPWWGLAEILALAATGWALVAWRHPRLRGERHA